MNPWASSTPSRRPTNTPWVGWTRRSRPALYSARGEVAQDGRARAGTQREAIPRSAGRGNSMPAIEKTREDPLEELKRLGNTANGSDKLYSILTGNFIPFDKLPIRTLVIGAILSHDYAERK